MSEGRGDGAHGVIDVLVVCVVVVAVETHQGAMWRRGGVSVCSRRKSVIERETLGGVRVCVCVGRTREEAMRKGVGMKVVVKVLAMFLMMCGIAVVRVR